MHPKKKMQWKEDPGHQDQEARTVLDSNDSVFESRTTVSTRRNKTSPSCDLASGLITCQSLDDDIHHQMEENRNRHRHKTVDGMNNFYNQRKWSKKSLSFEFIISLLFHRHCHLSRALHANTDREIAFSQRMYRTRSNATEQMKRQ